MEMTSYFFLQQSQSNTYHQLFLQSRMSLFSSSEVQQNKLCLHRWSCRSEGGRRKPLVYLRALGGLPHVLMLAKWACTPILWISHTLSYHVTLPYCHPEIDFAPVNFFGFSTIILLHRKRTLSEYHTTIWLRLHCRWWRRSGDRDHPTILDELLRLKTGLYGSMTSLA